MKWVYDVLYATNATKAQIAQAALALFAINNIVGWVELSQAEVGAIGLAASSVFALIMAFTYQLSQLRVPSGMINASKDPNNPEVKADMVVEKPVSP